MKSTAVVASAAVSLARFALFTRHIDYLSIFSDAFAFENVVYNIMYIYKKKKIIIITTMVV